MNSKTDLLVQYALLVAAENDDPYRRALGPIHLIKFVYLGDLAHASKNGGETFTGTRWVFYSFGPWSNDVNRRLEPAAEAVEANRKVHPSKKFEKDAIRFDVAQDEQRMGSLEELIPANVAAAIRSAVKTYGNDTKTLLRDVYLTPPMLHAAPGDVLDFSVVAEPDHGARLRPAEGLAETTPASSEVSPSARVLSVNQRKKIAAEAARRLAATSASREATLSVAVEPRYDEVFVAGLRWLDEMGGQPIPESESGELHFADSIWKDSARRNTKV